MIADVPIREIVVPATLDEAAEIMRARAARGASVSFMSTGNSTLQLASDPAMRGRVMALWFVALQGSTPIGGPLVGAIISLAGARTGLGVGALACVLAAGLGVVAQRRLRGAPRAALARDGAISHAPS